MNRRDLLRLGVATGLVVPAERFVRRFFPVGIDLNRPVYAGMVNGPSFAHNAEVVTVVQSPRDQLLSDEEYLRKFFEAGPSLPTLRMFKVDLITDPLCPPGRRWASLL